MECLIGIKGRDFVLMATDCVAGRSIIAMKKDQDKTFRLSDRLLMAIAGEGGDTVQFAEYIAKNIQLYRMRNGYDLSTSAAASFTRFNLAEYLRSRSAYFVNLLIGGYDAEEQGSLYYMDYLASSVKVPFAVHGYGAMFVLGLLDRYYRENMNKDDAVHLLQLCVNEIHKRFIVSMPRFHVKLIDKDGIQSLDDVVPKDTNDDGSMDTS